MASYRRGHKRRIPLWAMLGWNDATPAPDPVSRETDPEPTPAVTPAQPEQPKTAEPTPSE